MNSLTDLKADPRNPRTISEGAMKGLSYSIAEFGDLSGITFNTRTGELVCGHQRVKALRAQYGDLPIVDGAIATPDGHTFKIRLVDWPRSKQTAANVAANAATIQGEFTEDLNSLLAEIQAESPLVFDSLMLSEMQMPLVEPEPVEGLTGPDEAPEPPKDPISKPGDIWLLGNHRLLCGDSTEASNYEMLLAGTKAAMTFTDPPYNVNYANSAKDKMRGKDRPIMNDNLGDGFHQFLMDALTPIIQHTTGAIYVCMSSSELDVLQAAFREAGGKWSTFIIWAKNTFTMGRSDYQRQYEPILYGWPAKGKRHWCGARDQGDVWNIDKPRKNDLHPTMKPVELVERAIRNSSKPGDLVLDAFGGSGTTVIACEQSGRTCFGMELSPAYCDVIINRYINFTGKQAVHAATGRDFAEAKLHEA